MAKSFCNGWEIECNDGWNWFFVDTGDKATESRPCKRCGELPTEEGHDACIGIIEGAASACCGHGVEEPILIMENNENRN